MDRARSRIPEEDLTHDGKAALAEDIQRVRRWAHGMEPGGAHGVAVFCCSAADLFEVFRLASPLGPAVHIERTTWIEPLTAALPAQSWCVFLVNRRVARILRGSRDRLIEIQEFEDDVHGQHDQGGWSQARYQRSVEKEVQDHVQKACATVFDAFQRLAFDKLLIGCPSELWPEIEDHLHSYLLDKLVDHFDADVEHENPGEVLERVRPIIEREERREEAELMDELAERLGRHDRAVSGVGDVLDALNSSRVEAVLFAPSFEVKGVVCPRCGWLGLQGPECPADGTPVQRSDDLRGPMTRSAVLQSAMVLPIRYEEADRALGAPAAALLRF